MTDRPFLQIPVSTEEEQRLYEKWRAEEEKRKEQLDDSEGSVIVIDIE